MPMQVWLNGETTDAEAARISPFDRGFLFGDGLYEVVRYFNQMPVEMEGHIQRMKAGLETTSIRGFEASELESIGATLLDVNNLTDALFYLQVTRGGEASQRNHIPLGDVHPTTFGFATPAEPLTELTAALPVSCITAPDERWRRCDIKSINLLANVMAGLAAEQSEAAEAILHRGGYVSEGTKSNVFAVVNGWVVTPPISAEPSILHGITRNEVIKAARACGHRIDERYLRLEELRSASEIFITSTRRIVSGVARLDHHPISQGTVGPVTQQLFDFLRRQIAKQCGVKLPQPLQV